MSTTFKNEPRSAAPGLLLPRFPFQEPDYDIIIRSYDGVEFRTFMLLLSLTSKVFADMFATVEYGDEVQTVALEEDGTTLDLLLSYIDFRATQDPLPAIEVIIPAIAAASKYDMKRASEALYMILVSYVPSAPFRMYAIGCHMLKTNAVQGARLARAAALELLGEQLKLHSNIDHDFPEVETLPTRFTLILQRFHEECGKVASQQTCDLSWCSSSISFKFRGSMRSHFSWLPFKDTNEQHYGSGFYFPQWWIQFLTQLGGNLKGTPRPTSLPQFIALSGIELCPTTMPRSVAELKLPISTFCGKFRTFEDELLAQIDKAISEVPLDLGV